jgi:hypothetical protein
MTIDVLVVRQIPSLKKSEYSEKQNENQKSSKS